MTPFVGLMYGPAAGSLAGLTAPPYDVITDRDQSHLYDRSPYNVVRLILGRGEPSDDGLENKYTRAHAYLSAWRRDGVLVETQNNCHCAFADRNCVLHVAPSSAHRAKGIREG